jgi:hypothetical protein
MVNRDDKKKPVDVKKNMFPWAYKTGEEANKNIDNHSNTKRDEEMLSLDKKHLEKNRITPVKAPVKAPDTFKEILIRLPIEDYNYLVEEKNLTGVAPATNAAKFVREKIRELRSK